MTSRRTARFRIPELSEQDFLERLEIRLIEPDGPERQRYGELMEKHHYLASDAMVGEQLRYVAQVDGRWVALLGWSAAALRLKERERWVGWSAEQRRRRLALVANNARYLILPGVDCPNLASRALALCCARLPADWEQAYGHPVLLAESFVDGQLFRGTCYKARGWEQLGGLEGKLVMLDALHTCQETLRRIHQENGADYLMPVKGNCGGLEARASDRLPRPPAADLSPLGQARVRRGAGGEPAAAAVRHRRK